jgi:hypothetical protein
VRSDLVGVLLLKFLHGDHHVVELPAVFPHGRRFLLQAVVVTSGTEAA